MLDKKTTEKFKNKLLEEKNKLEEKLLKIAVKENGDYKAKFKDIGRDEEDNAEEVEEYTANIGITETLEKNLKEVEAALARIEEGTYGVCKNCPGEEIPLERLEAYPAASTCIKCKKN